MDNPGAKLMLIRAATSAWENNSKMCCNLKFDHLMSLFLIQSLKCYTLNFLLIKWDEDYSSIAVHNTAAIMRKIDIQILFFPFISPSLKNRDDTD